MEAERGVVDLPDHYGRAQIESIVRKVIEAQLLRRNVAPMVVKHH